ncbi:GNAT family N-acetyltransferase [Kangiella sediminilitoris]|uniref:N-acetyltransferase n=1 Tax=Kangiella sediminilitoris TaxID=1144748 RepID=A0A1B3B9X3_9GAMM|nr:GNAT family N-acetyltransferase [Kangiella sediminilitoris]AOE49610.1 hypothetical protein KS2013_888 [Kangiella sediminilitoris]
MSETITLKPVLSISDISADDWRHLLNPAKPSEATNPFIQYEFLKALEDSGSVSAENGWQSCHLAFYKAGELIAIIPNYIKGHSYGEYVFDWTWAEAYERNGQKYYPKALSAVPMTPVTGPRVITHLKPEQQVPLIEAAIQWTQQNHLSSWHINFTCDSDDSVFTDERLLQRSDIQFHWHNNRYESFEEFLTCLKAKKRKNILRERRAFGTGSDNYSDWDFVWLDGHTASSDDWQLFYRMYRNTFDKKGGWAQLSQGFFECCANALPDQTLLLLARLKGEPVAGAFFMKSDTALYGRYWGCFEEVEFLHFETCYYRGIEYAIEHGLSVFEPGAQGEHKLARGFTPAWTRSFHYIEQPQFRAAIAKAISQEAEWLELRYEQYLQHSPYKAQ